MTDMVAGRPAHLAVVLPDWSGGHNLVVDGYNTNDFYHLNFGWGGQWDGWYRVPEGIPFDLTDLEGVIVDILGDANSTLAGTGVLVWNEVRAGATVSGSFLLRNTGPAGSHVNWSIAGTPAWGTWTFSPSHGEYLTPADGPIVVNVTVAVPDEKRASFGGAVTVADTGNPDNACVIEVALATSAPPPGLRAPLLDLLVSLLSRLPFLYGGLRAAT
jgi:hypothetical protein